MATIKRMVLDVLKPRHPSIVDFASAIADLGRGGRVKVTVDEVDDKTESVMLRVEGDDLDFEAIKQSIKALGGSLHSIDEIEAASNTRFSSDDEASGEMHD